jgi:hypothetical protein
VKDGQPDFLWVSWTNGGSRRLSAAYVRATGAVSNTRVLTRPTIIVPECGNDEVAIKPKMKKQKKAASGTSVHIAR